jgi:hypothetical protein
LPSKNESEIRERATQLLEHLEIAESESHTHQIWDSGNFRWAAAVVREVLALLASRETPRQEEELQWVRKFIEYARYELEPGEMQLGDQFPRQGDADKAIGILDRILGRETPQEPRQPEEGK